MADLTGQIIDNGMYHLIKLLGEGTFGEVYLAKKIRTKIPTSTFVAVKILKPDSTKNQDDFIKEVRTLVRLKHPHIVSLLDFGIDGKIAFLVMEYAPNGTLRKRHPSGSILTPETVLTYIEPLASALQYAHDEGVLHRDVKPINILLGQNNKILLSDLGTADTAHNENSLITQEDLFGTISYMAPEQINKRPEMASDQYALGTMTYEWLCGARPFQGNPLENLTKLPPPLREKNPAIHPSIESVVLKALAKEPRDRHANIQAFAQAFKDAIRQIEEKDAKRSNIKPDPPSALLAPAPQIEPAANIFGVLSPPISNRTTAPLTPRGPAPIPATPPAAGGAGNPGQLPRPRRPSGKGAGAVSLGVATTPPHAAPSQNRLALGPSNVTPYPGRSRGVPPRYGHNTVNPKRWFIVGLLILTIVLAFTGVIAFAQPESLLGQVARNFLPVQPSLATITITPNSQTLQDTYILIGAQTTNPTTHEVAVRTITRAAQSPATPVQSTGRAQHGAVAANGQITFFNSLTVSQQINSGLALSVGGGVQIVTDKTALIQAANPPTAGSATVPAHAIPAGRAGNIGAYMVNGAACCATGITVSNTATFTGGEDAVNYTFLQQSDVVDNAISQSIKDTTKQEAISDLSKQLHTDEQLLTAPRCTSTLQADEPIGDQGTNVSSANVRYGLKCTVTAYDNLGVQNIIKDLLTQKATTTLGAGYVLVNNIQASFTGQTTTKTMLSFFFTGKGVWAYLFSDAQKLSLEKAIAGKTVADAQTLLKNTPGVSNATINVNGGNTLPTDYNQISIVIQTIAGLGGGTPPPTSGSPTVTNPTVQSGTPGSNGKGGSAPSTGGGS